MAIAKGDAPNRRAAGFVFRDLPAGADRYYLVLLPLAPAVNAGFRCGA
jgi:hypothetical protein